MCTNFYVDLSDFANLNIVLSCMQIVYGGQFLLPGWSHYGSQLSIHIQCLAYLHWIFNFKIWLNCGEQQYLLHYPLSSLTHPECDLYCACDWYGAGGLSFSEDL